MKTRISLVLKDNDFQEIISTVIDPPFDPYNVGDVVELSVSTTEYFSKGRTDLIEKRNELFQSFHLKDVEITEKRTFLEVFTLETDVLTIEYYCKLI